MTNSGNMTTNTTTNLSSSGTLLGSSNNIYVNSNTLSNSSWSYVSTPQHDDMLEVFIWNNRYEVNIKGKDLNFDELYNINNMTPSDFIDKYQYALENRYTTYTDNTMYSELYRIALKLKK